MFDALDKHANAWIEQQENAATTKTKKINIEERIENAYDKALLSCYSVRLVFSVRSRRKFSAAFD